MFRIVRTLVLGGVGGKLLGVARELVAAALLGTGPTAAAYRLSQAAFMIPIQGFLSDTLTSGFIPAYAKDGAHDSAAGRVLFSGMHAALLLVSIVTGALLALLATPWVSVLAPGFDASTARLATTMSQVLALAMPLYALTALYAAANLAAGKAELTAARTSFQSAGMMVGTVLAWWLREPLLIPFGFVLAYLALALWGLRSIKLSGLRLWPRGGEWVQTRQSLGVVWSAYRILIWVPALMQVHFIVERRVASLVSPHGVAALDYVRFVSDTAVLLLAMPFGVAGLAALASVGEHQFRVAALRSLRVLLYLGVPLSVAFAVHADWAMKILFGRGAFGAESVAATATILRAVSFGLWAQLVGYAGIRFLSARKRNRPVLFIYLTATGCNIALNLLLQPVIGIAALGVASAANSIVLGILVARELDLVQPLGRDLGVLLAAACGYEAIWLSLPANLTDQVWLPPLLLLSYWSVACYLVPRFRLMFVDTWRAVRTA